MGLRKKIKKFIYNNNINRKYGKFATDKTIKKNWNKSLIELEMEGGRLYH